MVPGVVPDARPVKAEDYDCNAWTKAAQQLHTPALMEVVTPQQLGVGVSGGVELKVWGLKLWYEKNKSLGIRAVGVALDVANAHNTFDREASIEALNSIADADESLRSLPRAWHSLIFQKNGIFVRDINEAFANGWSFLCDSSAGGGQGNPLTGLAFVATIDAALKGIESKFGVEIRAIQDDMTIMGDPDTIFGPGMALESLLELLDKVGLKPNKSKFSASAPRTTLWRTPRTISSPKRSTCGTQRRVRLS
jgi:hypothetical protein